MALHLPVYVVSNIRKRTTQREKNPDVATTWATPSDWQQGIFYMQHPTDRISHTTTFGIQVVGTGWNEKQLNGFIMRNRSDDPSRILYNYLLIN